MSKVILYDEAFASLKARVWYPPACENTDAYIDHLLSGCEIKGIVLCKDCQFSKIFQNDSSGVRAMYCRAFTFDRMVDEDDFCSYGERKENE